MGPGPQGRILVISNGHGEDAIAAAIVSRLPAGLSAEAYPTLGGGEAFRGICPIVGPRAHLPSEGSRVHRGSWVQDLKGGVLGTLWPGLRFLHAARGSYRQIVVVGDMLGVLAAALAGLDGLIYADVYKTGHGRPYNPLEIALIGRSVRVVFCRNARLAGQLAAAGIDARAAGNVMLDTVPDAPFAMEGRRKRPLALTLLPGSRAPALANFARQVEAVRTLPSELLPDLFAAVAGTVPAAALAEAAGLDFVPPGSGEETDLGMLREGVLSVHLASGRALRTLLAGADVVLSQAGTATVQALGFGKPVIGAALPGERRSRFRAEQALFGDGRVVTNPDGPSLGAALQRLLADGAERERRGAIGRERVGAPGALDAIIAELGRGVL